MPKQKTNRGAMKRFRATGKGKVKKKSANLRHLLSSKGSKRKRQLRKGGYVAKVDMPKIRKLIGA